MPRTEFPILQSDHIASVPWEMILPHEKQAYINHHQTLEQLADRGGLGPDEALCVIEDRRLGGPMFVVPQDRDARNRLDREQAQLLRARVEDWRRARGERDAPETYGETPGAAGCDRAGGD